LSCKKINLIHRFVGIWLTFSVKQAITKKYLIFQGQLN